VRIRGSLAALLSWVGLAGTVGCGSHGGSTGANDDAAADGRSVSVSPIAGAADIGSGNATTVGLVIDARGTATMIWADQPAIEASRYTQQGGWNAPDFLVPMGVLTTSNGILPGTFLLGIGA
jgi:hypothetical protein